MDNNNNNVCGLHNEVYLCIYAYGNMSKKVKESFISCSTVEGVLKVVH